MRRVFITPGSDTDLGQRPWACQPPIEMEKERRYNDSIKRGKGWGFDSRD